MHNKGNALSEGPKCGQPRIFCLRRFGAIDSLHHLPPTATLSARSRPELEALLAELLGEIATLKQTVAEPRD